MEGAKGVRTGRVGNDSVVADDLGVNDADVRLRHDDAVRRHLVLLGYMDQLMLSSVRTRRPAPTLIKTRVTMEELLPEFSSIGRWRR